MVYEKLEILSRVYNTLLLINTKGEDTIVMADCLRALHNFIFNEEQNLKNSNIEVKKAEGE